MASLADSSREGGFAGAGTGSLSASAQSQRPSVSPGAGNISAGRVPGGGGDGGRSNLAASTRDGGFGGAGVAGLSQTAQAQRPTVSPGAGNVASGGIAGIKSSTGFFSGAAKAADYDTIQQAVVAARSPLDAFGLKTLTDFGVKSFEFKNALDDYQALLNKTPNPTAAQKAQFETLGDQLNDRAKALQQEAATISGFPVNKAGFSSLAEGHPFDFSGTYAPETYGLTFNKAGVGTAPGYDVIGPYNLGGYEGVYLGVTDRAPTMVTKRISDLAPEQPSFAPSGIQYYDNNYARDVAEAFRTPSAAPVATTPYPEMRYTYSGPKTGMFEQFGGAMAPGLSTAAMAAGYRAATGAVPASEYARQYFQSRGLSPMQSAALVARYEHESSLNPDQWSGVPGESSYGLAQWNREAGRLPQLERYAASYNAPASDFDTQLNFTVREMNTTEQAARDALMRATTPAAALNAVTAYERPAGYTRKDPTLASGYADTLNRFNAIMAGQPYRNYDVLSGTEFKGPGSGYAAPMPVAGQKQIEDRIAAESNVVPEEVAPAPVSIVPSKFPDRLLSPGTSIVPPAYSDYSIFSPTLVGRDPYEGVPVPAAAAAPAQVAEAVVQRRTGAPAIPNYQQNFFGALIEKFTGLNAGNNYRPFDTPVDFFARDRGEGGRGKKKPIIPPVEEVTTAAAPAPANTGLVWDFQADQAPVVSAPPDVYAQYRSLFAQPAPISTGVGSLLPTMEVLPVRS